MTLKQSAGSRPEDSYRWLMGEDATAFGGAIRDMWTPTCLGDPGKVTDAEYHCATTTAAASTRTRACRTTATPCSWTAARTTARRSAAIGLIKAAHLYWRAQSVYQTPTTDFDDHADALEASCTDLIGEPLEGAEHDQHAGRPVGPVDHRGRLRRGDRR